MNWDQIAGNWKKIQGSIREQWGELTDDDVQRIKGNRDRFVGALRERYGYTKDVAERELDAWAKDRTH